MEHGDRNDTREFGVHLDAVNMITSPRRYFFNDEFLEECFRKLGGAICSCHLKDIRLKEEYIDSVRYIQSLESEAQM